ncbi:sulfite exporter TauE/SafE family protein [Geomonas sp. RF6]|uniref:sulfite exporter TauE/SafE family protein n=1 Tax=Geomonas sp. RF6 TaxID=2897342 RepID=UPI001E5DFE32|nr:sulfite exporter TauE/SafE family protein [Geomonas sp. RF6]UFS72139.1 sulfite exporter TauE/SafE family protein [Geomonas sp. RF6]
MVAPEVTTFCTGFAAGIAGFAHCLGMCGGFVLFLSHGKGGRWGSELQWHLGKLFSYLLLGAVAGYAGGYLEGALGGFLWFQKIMAWVVGALFLLAAASLLGLIPVRGGDGCGEGVLSLCFTTVCSARAPGAPLLAGVATAFLPCPVVLALIAHALRLGSVLSGIVLMAGLAAGTALPLLLLAGAGRRLVPAVRGWAPRLAGILLLLLGAGTVLRSTSFYHLLLGCPRSGARHDTHPPKGETVTREVRHAGERH